MLVIFCADPLLRSQPDPDYAGEYATAQAVGQEVALMSYEALVDHGDAAEAVRRVPTTAPGEPPALALYRGWMLRPADYVRLYAALAEHGLCLINTPDAYRICHYLPEAYPYIADHTPATVWLPLPAGAARHADLDMAQIMQALQPFGVAPLILKDYVKSRKHEWNTACYIPSAADKQAVERVVGAFLRLQGPDFSEGLVFRAYTALQPVGTHPRSGMPLAREYRRFYLDGAPLATSAYWDVADAADEVGAPPVDLFAEVARRIPSRFFTMDVARTLTGEWIIVELGDGQVAGLPERLPAADFYSALAAVRL